MSGVGGALNPPGDALQLDAAQQAAAANAAAQKTRTGYNRFDQERYAGKDETGGFSIDTKLTYQPLGGGMSLTPNPNAATPVHESSKPGYYQNGSSSTANGSSNNQLVQQKTNVIANKIPAPAGISANIANSGQQKRTHTKPIIIIPNTATSLITMYNVIDILQDLKYRKFILGKMICVNKLYFSKFKICAFRGKEKDDTKLGQGQRDHHASQRERPNNAIQSHRQHHKANSSGLVRPHFKNFPLKCPIYQVCFVYFYQGPRGCRVYHGQTMAVQRLAFRLRKPDRDICSHQGSPL